MDVELVVTKLLAGRIRVCVDVAARPATRVRAVKEVPGVAT